MLHSVHVLAPESTPVLVLEPASQSVQLSTPELAEYWPAEHGVHAVAPGAAPVLVIEPAWHCRQYDWLPWDWYCPASHCKQDGALVLS